MPRRKVARVVSAHVHTMVHGHYPQNALIAWGGQSRFIKARGGDVADGLITDNTMGFSVSVNHSPSIPKVRVEESKVRKLPAIHS